MLVDENTQINNCMILIIYVYLKGCKQGVNKMAGMKWMDGFSWVGGGGGASGSAGGSGVAGGAGLQSVYQAAQAMIQAQAAQQGTQVYEITDHTPEAVDVAVLEKPVEKPIPSQLTEIKTDLKEYAELAAIVGISPAELTIETFKAFLHEHDIPVFNLKEVITYMDDKAKKESKDKAGWYWKPLRQKDHRISTSFGIEAKWIGPPGALSLRAASDWYRYPGKDWSYVYDKLVPLHALKKVALIEKHFGDKVGVFVCDYAPIPAIPHPDPFLMAVIANPRVKEGEGRWVIDFWNEPGFGLTQMLK